MKVNLKSSFNISLISNSAKAFINFRKELIEFIKKLNFEVTCFAPDIDSESAILLRRLGAKPVVYTLSRTGINPVKELISIFSLAAAIRREKPDIIFCFQIKPAIYGSIGAFLNRNDNLFVMIEGLGYVFTDNKIKTRLLRKLIKILFRTTLKRAKKIFFLNNDDKKEFIKLKIINPERTIVLGGIGVDLEEWSYSEPDLSETSFIFVGRLLKEKGILDYLEAARMVKMKFPDVKFYVLGEIDSNPGSISRKLMDYYIEKGIVEWPGYVDVKPWLQKASVFVLPSYYREGVPRSTQEAMATGRAVITTDMPGCRETVIDGLNGFLVPPRNPRKLAKTMEIFIRNKDLIKKMGYESRKLAEQKFNVMEKNKIIIKEILENLIPKPN